MDVSDLLRFRDVGCSGLSKTCLYNFRAEDWIFCLNILYIYLYSPTCLCCAFAFHLFILFATAVSTESTAVCCLVQTVQTRWVGNGSLPYRYFVRIYIALTFCYLHVMSCYEWLSIWLCLRRHMHLAMPSATQHLALPSVILQWTQPLVPSDFTRRNREPSLMSDPASAFGVYISP